MIGVITKLFAACAGGNFFSFPHWYDYLPGCSPDNLFNPSDTSGRGIIALGGIVLVIVDILLRIAGMVAVGFIIWGGVQFITAQGDPGATKKARQTIINAVIGLVVALISVGVVRFIGSRLGAG